MSVTLHYAIIVLYNDTNKYNKNKYAHWNRR